MNRKIVVIVDMQHDFIDGALGTPEARAMMPRFIQQIKDDPKDTAYIFTRDTHNEDYLSTMEGRNLPILHCVKGTWNWDIRSDFYDIFVNKPFIVDKSTFGSIELMETIKDFIDEDTEIEFRGVCTDICVVSNAILAKTWFPENLIAVNSNLCAGSTPEKHEAALEVMKSCQIKIM